MATVAQRTVDANGRNARRSRRYEVLNFWRRWTVREGGRFCLMALEQAVHLSGTADGTVHLAGVRRCASTWCCPVCTPTIRERRAGEIDQGVGAHLAAGGYAYLVTATLQHDRGDDLAALMDLGQKAWSATFGGRQIQRERQAHGYVGQIRAWDFTYGANGWHPHIHAVVLCDRPAGSWLWSIAARWGAKVADGGGYTDVTSARSPGWDVRPVTDSAGMSDYLCKVDGGWGAGLELARADMKRGSRSGVTPAALLEAAADGDIAARALVSVYEQATAGRRAIVWGRGLKARLGVSEISDDEAARTEPADVVTVHVVIPAKAWRRLLWRDEAGAVLASVALLAAGLDPTARTWRWPDGWLFAWRQSSALPG